jgi:hypothetical protein
MPEHVPPGAFGGQLAEAGQEEIARAAARLGAVVSRSGERLFSVAMERRDEVDAVEFAKAKADVDAWWRTSYLEESQNPDYEGIFPRVRGNYEKFAGEILGRIGNSRVAERLSQYLELKGVSEEGNLQELFLAKQTNHRNAVFEDAYGKLVTNRDRAGVAALVSGASWLDETTRQKYLSGAMRSISFNDALADIAASPKAWTFDPERYPDLDEETRKRLESHHRSELSNAREEERRALEERYRETEEALSTAYMQGKSVSAAQLLTLRDKGLLDPDRALTWTNRFEGMVERRIAMAERAENRAFRTRWKKATPEERDFMKLEQFGTSRTEAEAAYERLYAGILSGRTDEVTVTDAVADGLLSERQGRRLLGTLREDRRKRDVLDGKARSVARSNLRSSLKALDLLDLQFDALAEFDEAAASGAFAREQFDDLARGILKRMIEESGAPTTSWMGLRDTDAGKMLRMIEKKGYVEIGEEGEATLENGKAPEAESPEPLDGILFRE